VGEFNTTRAIKEGDGMQFPQTRWYIKCSLLPL